MNKKGLNAAILSAILFGLSPAKRCTTIFTSMNRWCTRMLIGPMFITGTLAERVMEPDGGACRCDLGNNGRNK
jgi:hypothetical protein